MKKKKKVDDTKLRERILQVLRKRAPRALHASEVRGRVGVDKTEHAEVLRLLEQLIEQGLVARSESERYQARAPMAIERTLPRGRGQRSERGTQGREGVLTLHPRGFGFVVIEGQEQDVFIPPNALGTAMHGDRVRVRQKPSPKGFDGQVIAVLKRAAQFVGGQLHVTADGAFLESDDERLRMPIRVEGKLSAGAQTGLGAIAKVVRHPERAGDALVVKIIETFEPDAFVQYEIKRILLRENVSEEFAADVQAEADALPHAITARDRRGREDLRDLPLLTIDPKDARDHDDAVWAERKQDGGYRVLVAIADVSHYVPEGSALDREALERGCTIYLPTRAIPMLPAALSSNLASLLPKRDRLTLAVEVLIDSTGSIVSHRFIEGVMRSPACLSYEGVAQALGLTMQGPNQVEATEHLAELTVLLEVAKLLREQRRARGSLQFELPEAKVRVDDETGIPIDVERTRKDPGVALAYGMIEELMLLANEVVAADLTERELPTLYPIHPPPDPERIETFCALAKALGFVLSADVAEHPKRLGRFLNSIAGTPHAAALGYLLLRSMQQATYDTTNVGHFGLAAEHYSHFTSPIRRYPDLALHRIVRSVARGERASAKSLPGRLKEQASQSSQRERRSMAIEREVVDLYGAYLLRNQVGESFDATISGVTDHGFYATLDAPFVDVLCRVVSLPIDRYQLDAHGIRLLGTVSGRSYALGDRVRLRIDSVSIAQRKVLAVPAEMPTTPPSMPRPFGERQRGRRTRPEPVQRPRAKQDARRARKQGGKRPKRKP